MGEGEASAMIETVSEGAPTYDVFQTALGWVAIVATREGVRRTSLPEPDPQIALASAGVTGVTAVHDPDAVAGTRSLIARYCEGQAADLSGIRLDVNDRPEFFQRAWQACRSIPAGETRSYAWLAAQAGNSRAARGAGQAMARNPVPLLVPCHRVVGSGGGLHGFGGSVGLPMKQRLLELESRPAGPAA